MRRYPPLKPRQRSWPARNRAEQAKFRKAVLAKAGGQCQYVDRVGVRCPVTGDENLVAHHTEPGNPDPVTGMALCRHHHRVVDKWAR